VRTGQAHRTLIGHTGPVTCVQFDEYHLVSGSLDKSIRVSEFTVDLDAILFGMLIVSSSISYRSGTCERVKFQILSNTIIPSPLSNSTIERSFLLQERMVSR